ncbi:MAG: thiamine pyrophosphate-dependent enzyme [Bacillota bacterium]|nr:pyruvate ferredoxin oxidoreductase beta subunit [Bacillota bacterium]
MANLRELTKKDELLCGGHRACAGCAAPIAVRQALKAVDTPVVVGCATGCLEVTTTIYPFTSWRVPFIHSAFENSAATISGVEAAYRALKKKGKITRDIQFIAFGGDGGTYDIGFQSLSGAMERGHDMVYICYDNEAYMNTGIQRSSATPKGASTTTSPAGKVIPGKVQFRKDLTAVMAAHNIPYVAQAVPSHWNDFITKVQKALAVKGPAFINVLAPCRLGWQFDPAETIDIMRGAVETCFWPLYEVENGVWRVTHKPREKKPVRGWLEKQGRFRHLFRPGNEHIIEEIQADIDRNWEALLARAGAA